MQKMLIADALKCTGCHTCESVCSLKKLGMVNPVRARLHVMRFDKYVFDVPMVCQQCVNAPCMSVCPVKAITRDNEVGVVLINQDKCIGCKACMGICPFGAAGFDPTKGKAFKCDQCEGDPTCVKFCEPQAIQFVDVSKANMLKGRDGAMKITAFLSGQRIPGMGAGEGAAPAE